MTIEQLKIVAKIADLKMKLLVIRTGKPHELDDINKAVVVELREISKLITILEDHACKWA